VFWLGGGCGAGKTTVAVIVARRLDLRLYPVEVGRRTGRGASRLTAIRPLSTARYGSQDTRPCSAA
jgi:predicted kinase